MSQQLLANKHNRLRDSRLSLVWPSGGLGLVADKTMKTRSSFDLITALFKTELRLDWLGIDFISADV